MSENSKKVNISLIITIAAAVLAIAAVLALIFSGGGSDDSSPQYSEEYRPTEEFEQECESAAQTLVSSNYEIIRLFVTEGLPHLDEPYGNAPEDGIYTVDTANSRGYSSLEDIEALVKSVYTDDTAAEILGNNGAGVEVYLNRTVFVDVSPTESNSSRYTEGTVLGISADFTADTTRAEAWASCSVAVLPTSDTECGVTIYLGGNEAFRTEMIKTDAGWRLTEYIY